MRARISKPTWKRGVVNLQEGGGKINVVNLQQVNDGIDEGLTKVIVKEN